ncbi:hypothetical protein BC829DRAFT_387342 [Chytridium lagenaria]|nr:hypothetical protein BC829DRAFT_387342 [Chytridium lagenaria]
MEVVMGLQGNLQSEEALLIILEKCGDEFLENGWLNAEAALLVIEEVARRGWVKSSQELIGITSKAVANDESGVKAVLERMLVACCDAAVNIVEKLTTPDLSEIQSHLLTILNSLLNLPPSHHPRMFCASFETLTLLLLPYTTSTHVATETLADVIAAQDYASLRVAASSPSATPILTFLLAATLANAVENVRVLVDAGADRCKRLGFMGVVEILEGKKAKKGRRKVGRDGFRMSGMWGSAKVVAVDGVVKEKE